MKTNQDHQRIAAAFERLFRTYGPLGQGSTPEEIARDRIGRIKVYFEAVSLYLEADVEAAVDNFLNGSAPGVNPNFAPPAPAFAAEVRRVMNERVRIEALDRSLHPRLPPPDIERTPESQARVRALMEQTIGRLVGGDETEDAAKAAAHKAQWGRVNERFNPEADEEAMAARLGYVTGDAEGEAA